jgi:uncharacterized membrane protein
MGQMMGTTAASGMAAAMPGWVWAALAGLIVLTVIGAVGLGFYLAYPEIKSAEPAPETQLAQAPPPRPEVSWDVLMRTSKPEEKRVLDVLAAHDGTYLQKFIVKEAGLSKLKTHRIVSRLAERGVVSVEKSGNTNKVSLSPWVQSASMKPVPGVSPAP